MLFPDDESHPAGLSRGLFILLGGLVLVVAIGGLWWMTQLEPAPPPAAGEPAPAAPSDPVDARPESPAPAARDGSPSRPARRAEPAEAPAAAPEAAAPVARGVLRVQSDVNGASVFLDRTFVGTTPLEKSGLEPGSHQLNVSAEGYEGVARTVTIGDEPAEVTVRFKEVRLDAAIPVVHRHRMGSCEGRLVATVEGLRYETANRGDAFAVPVRPPAGLRGGLPEEEPPRAPRRRQDLQLRGTRGQRRRALRLPPRRGEGAGPAGGARDLRAAAPPCGGLGRHVASRRATEDAATDTRWPGSDAELAARTPPDPPPPPRTRTSRRSWARRSTRSTRVRAAREPVSLNELTLADRPGQDLALPHPPHARSGGLPRARRPTGRYRAPAALRPLSAGVDAGRSRPRGAAAR